MRAAVAGEVGSVRVLIEGGTNLGSGAVETEYDGSDNSGGCLCSLSFSHLFRSSRKPTHCTTRTCLDKRECSQQCCFIPVYVTIASGSHQTVCSRNECKKIPGRRGGKGKKKKKVCLRGVMTEKRHAFVVFSV